MASINYATREISCKIVYYGPGLSGKTTNLQIIHRKIPVESKSEMVSLATETDRTLFFDFLPLDLGSIKGFATKFQLYTVPGQVYYNATRKLVLRGVDGVVFVADSQRDKMQENIDSLKNLQENLKEYGIDLGSVPFVLQYNKRDLPGVATIVELDQHVNWFKVPTFEAQAHQGVGVFTTLKAIGKIVIDTFNAKYSARQSSRRPSTSDVPSAASHVPSTAPQSAAPSLPPSRPAVSAPPPRMPPPRPTSMPTLPPLAGSIPASPPSRPQPAVPLSAPTFSPAPSNPSAAPAAGYASHPANPLPSAAPAGYAPPPPTAPVPGLQANFFQTPQQSPAAQGIAAVPGLVDAPRAPQSAPSFQAPGLVETPVPHLPPPVDTIPGLQTGFSPRPIPQAAPFPSAAPSTPAAPDAVHKKGRLDGTLDPSDLDAEIARYERELAEQKAHQEASRVVNAPNTNPNMDGTDPLASAFLTPEELNRLQGQDSFPTRRMPLGPGQQ